MVERLLLSQINVGGAILYQFVEQADCFPREGLGFGEQALLSQKPHELHERVSKFPAVITASSLNCQRLTVIIRGLRFLALFLEQGCKLASSKPRLTSAR